MDNGLGHLPTGYEALADTPGVMREAANHLTDLSHAASRLGDALVTVGLPAREWKSQEAYFNLLTPTLPHITLGGYLARLTKFADVQGTKWLRGARIELDQFHEEVAALNKVSRALAETSRRLVRGPPVSRGGTILQRAFSHYRILALLDGVAEILGDLEALAPYMQPLPPEAWDGASASATWPLVSGFKALLAMFSRLLRSQRAQPKLRQMALAAGGLALVIAVVGGIALTQHSRGIVASIASHRATATSGADATPEATSTESPTRVPTPRPTAAPAVQVTLACAVNGTTATLTIHNANAFSVAWQANAPFQLTVTPAQGVLTAGQSTTAQVTAKGRKAPTGMITVTATHAGVSTPQSVTC